MSAEGRVPLARRPWLRLPSPLALCLLLLSGAASAAPPAGDASAEPLSVREMTVVWTHGKAEEGLPRENLSLPVVQPAASAAASRINRWLAIELLNRLPPTPPPVRWVLAAKDAPDAPNSLSFKVSRNDRQVLTLALDREFCGAYCESSVDAISFDVRSGRHLAAADLLTPAGLGSLGARIAQQRLARLQQAVRQAQAQLRRKGLTAEDRDTAEAQVAMYQECAQWLSPGDLSRNSFSVASDGLHFVHGRCSNHAMRAIDDLMDFDNRVPLAEARPHLSPYGLALLFGEGAVAAPVTATATRSEWLLLGQIGGAPVTLRLQAADGDRAGRWSGVYFYDKHGRPITLEGRRDGARWELQELDADGKDTARLSLVAQPDRWSGDWQSPGKKSLPVTLTP